MQAPATQGPSLVPRSRICLPAHPGREGQPVPHLVQLVLQKAGVEAQGCETVLLHGPDDLVHLCVVLGRQVREVDVGRDEVPAQDIGVEVPQDFLGIPAAQSGEGQVERQGWARSWRYLPDTQAGPPWARSRDISELEPGIGLGTERAPPPGGGDSASVARPPRLGKTDRRREATYSTTHFSFMMLALKPSTANTTRVASTDVKKLMKDTSAASKWQLLSCLL